MRTISRQCSGSSLRKPREAPKPALAKATSRRPKRSRACATIASCCPQSVTSQATASARSVAAELVGQRLEPVHRARGQDQAEAGLRGAAGGGGADAGARAGDEEDLVVVGHGAGPFYDGACMLYDKARIFVQGGGGGDGCRSFRREAHVPRGGPDGGDGGRGGDVVLLCDDSLRDLQSFKRKAHYKARRGGHGEGALRHGADGGDLVVLVPPGHAGRRLGGHRVRPRGPGRARRAGPRRVGRARQQALRHRHAPGAALRRARAARARRAGSSCSSSCWPTSASSACPTRASPRCCRA